MFVGLDTELAAHGEPQDGRYPLPSLESLQAAARDGASARVTRWSRTTTTATSPRFSMAMDDLYSHPQARFALAYNGDGELEGFLHMVPSRRGYSLSSMRRLRSTPNGLIEFLIAELMDWAKHEGAEEISLNFSVFADVLRADGTASWPIRATRWSLLRLDRLFQLERLFSFNRKFFPEWRTRYICFERHRDVPVLGVATLHVERLLAPPKLAAQRPSRR